MSFWPSGIARTAAMQSNEYHFISDWQVEGTLEEVSAILTDTASLPRWWPSVYLDVTRAQFGFERWNREGG